MKCCNSNPLFTVSNLAVIWKVPPDVFPPDLCVSRTRSRCQWSRRARVRQSMTLLKTTKHTWLKVWCILIAYAIIVMNTHKLYELSVDITHEAAIWLTDLSLISHKILNHKFRNINVKYHMMYDDSMVRIRYILHFWHFWFACSDVVFVNRSLFESNLFSELFNEPYLNGSFRNRTESVRAILESTTYWTENHLFWDEPWILMFEWKDALIDKQQKFYYWKCARWPGLR